MLRLLLSLILLAPALSFAQQKKIYLAPDDHTDFLWSANERDSYAAFISQLDYFLGQIAETSGEVARAQARFSTDGSLWLKIYRDGSSNVTPAIAPGPNWTTLLERLRSGHIASPLTPLVVTWGAVPAEGVLRSMYFPGKLERAHGVQFPVAQAMENMTLPLGLGSLFAGAGAKYFWHGVCNCATSVTAQVHAPHTAPSSDGNPYEVYRWTGKDGSTLLTKWYSYSANTGIGGYAEARDLAASLNTLTNDSAFTTRHPWLTRGAFGYGWDDVFPTGTNFYTAMRNAALTDSDPNRTIRLSNITDYFQALEAEIASGAPALPTLAASLGNEWDVQCVSLAQVSARVKRATEKLRGAEAMATLVALKQPTFMDAGSRPADRETAFMNMGLYFEHDFVDYQFLNERRDWQRRLAREIEAYVDSLHTDAAAQLGGLITNPGAATRFFVFNPLSWSRTDVADFPYTGSSDIHVHDLSAGVDVPSQIVSMTSRVLLPQTASGQPASYATTTHTFLRIIAQNMPSVGYKVFEIRPGPSGTTFTNPLANPTGGVIENADYRVTVSGSGAITSFQDRTRANLEFVAGGTGLKFNDLNSGGPASSGGTVALVGNAGPVSITLAATGTANPISHTTSVTLYRGLRRADIRNEVTTGFNDTMRYWSYRTALSPNPVTHHEEVGAVLRAQLTTAGGDYAVKNARYDFLTMNHFVAMTGNIGNNPASLTLSNADGFFFRLGNSTPGSLDTSTAAFHPVMGGRPNNGTGMAFQAGDSYLEQRFSLRTDEGFDAVAAMKFSLEHQNPLICSAVTGSAASPFPPKNWSFLTIDEPGVLLWALKPHEDGIAQGIVGRVWNVATASATMRLSLGTGPISSARRVSHIETALQPLIPAAGALADTIAGQKMQTYAFTPAPVSAFEAWKIQRGLPASLPADDDADGNGLALLLEYALDLDPSKASLSSLPTIKLNTPSTTASFTYLRARAELQYVVKTSTDLQTWTASGITQDESAVGQPATATVPFTSEPHRFFRLEVTHP